MRTLATSLIISMALVLGSAKAEDPVHFPDPSLKEAIEDELWVSDPTPTDMLGLTYLSTSSGDITNLTGLEYALNLQQLELTHHDFRDIRPLAGLSNLERLVLNNNRISDLSALSELTNLEYLDVHENEGVSDISVVSNLVTLQTLILRKNEISDISAISTLTTLERLDLRDNELSDISLLSGMPSLQDVDVSNNDISEIPPGFDLSSLEILDLRNNNITVLSGSFGLDDLEDLDLANNDIHSVFALSGLGNLITLDLGSNRISDISGLADLSNLQDLDLHMNEISDISPLLSLTSLTSLQLQSNPLSDEAHETHIPQIIANNPGINLEYDARSQYSLSLSSTAGGSVISPGEGTFTYTYDDFVGIEAEANVGFTFATWSGTFNLDVNPLFFTMTRNHQIRAHFLSMLEVIYVDDDAPEDIGSGDPDIGDPQENGTMTNPFDSIQEAIEVANEGTRIVVRPGIYYETIDFLGKHIELTGIDPNDPNAVAFPVIAAAGSGPIVTFTNGEDPNSLLRGFVIAQGQGDPAGAIYCKAGSPTIANCVIVGNRSIDPDGACVYCIDSEATFINCTIAQNYSGDMGAGLRAVDSHITIVNSILWDNGPIDILLEGTGEVSAAYSNVAGGWPGISNTNVDPLFALQGYWLSIDDPNMPVGPDDPYAIWIDGDYHLQSQAGRWNPRAQTWVQDELTSPCIDAGDPNTPIEEEPAPNGDLINIGAFGGTAQASKRP